MLTSSLSQHYVNTPTLQLPCSDRSLWALVPYQYIVPLGRKDTALRSASGCVGPPVWLVPRYSRSVAHSDRKRGVGWSEWDWQGATPDRLSHSTLPSFKMLPGNDPVSQLHNLSSVQEQKKVPAPLALYWAQGLAHALWPPCGLPLGLVC
eukprot:scaffold1219_cov400-Prasinococcus_capsulatus_cf.AAC.7